jgi:hypothetical protein
MITTVLLTVLLTLTGIADIESTRSCILRDTCYERNPIMQDYPYAVKFTAIPIVIGLSHQLRKSNSRFERILGYVLPIFMISLQSYATMIAIQRG